MERRFRYLTGVGILALAYFVSARLGSVGLLAAGMIATSTKTCGTP